MRYAKTIIALCCVLIISFVLTGCKISFQGATQIKDIEFIRAVGIDTAPDEKMRLTIATQRIIAGGGRGESSKSSPRYCIPKGDRF